VVKAEFIGFKLNVEGRGRAMRDHLHDIVNGKKQLVRVCHERRPLSLLQALGPCHQFTAERRGAWARQDVLNGGENPGVIFLTAVELKVGPVGIGALREVGAPGISR
jgi:hypothetical protein